MKNAKHFDMHTRSKWVSNRTLQINIAAAFAFEILCDAVHKHPVFDLASFCGSFRITMSKLNLVATHFMPCSVHCEQNANELWFCTPAAVDQVAIWAVVYSL